MYLVNSVLLIMCFKCISADSKDVTEINFTVSLNNGIPKCVNNTIRGPVTAQQRFRVSATSSDHDFGGNVTACFFNSTPSYPIILKPGAEKRSLTSDEVLFSPDMQDKQLICVLGFNVTVGRRTNDTWTITNIKHYIRHPAAMCVTTINFIENVTHSHLNQTDSGGNFTDYKKLMIIGFSMAGMLLLITIAQSIALCVFCPKGQCCKKRENTDKSKRASSVSDSGTIYEELKPTCQITETREMDNIDGQIAAKVSPAHPPKVDPSQITRFDSMPTSQGISQAAERRNIFKNKPNYNEYVPTPVPLSQKQPPRPPKPASKPKPVTPKKLQKELVQTPSSSAPAKRVTQLVTKLEANFKPPTPMGPVLSPTALKPKKPGVVPDQHASPQITWFKPHTPQVVQVPHLTVEECSSPLVPALPQRNYIEDERMDSEDSEDWTYEPIEDIYEMPEP